MTLGQSNTLRAKERTLSITVLRADGTVEELGVVSYWHRNPLRRLQWRMRRYFSGRN